MSTRRALLRSLVYTEAMVLVYSVILTLFPQYYWIVILLIMFTFLGYSVFTGYRRIRASRSGRDAEYVMSGRVVVKANPARITDMINRDPGVMEDMKPQIKMMSLSLVNLPIVIAIYYLYLGYVIHYFSSGGALSLFIGYVVLFEILFFVPWLLNRILVSGSEVRVVQILRDYIVTTRGVLATGLVLKFPIEAQGYRISCNKKRRFIDIEASPQTQALSNIKTVPVYRLYMSEQDLLRTIELINKTSNLNIVCE